MLSVWWPTQEIMRNDGIPIDCWWASQRVSLVSFGFNKSRGNYYCIHLAVWAQLFNGHYGPVSPTEFHHKTWSNFIQKFPLRYYYDKLAAVPHLYVFFSNLVWDKSQSKLYTLLDINYQKMQWVSHVWYSTLLDIDPTNQSIINVMCFLPILNIVLFPTKKTFTRFMYTL